MGPDGVLKDTRFILVRAECPYVQFAAVARVISIERFVVGGTNGRERDRSQVSDVRVERMPRARLLLSGLLCDVLCWIDLSPWWGALPFLYRPRGSRDYRWEKEEKTEVEKVF